ncbi:MAG TPA: flagellar regulator YcgR PilZN domain-containing protein [Nevskiaceae bacterium]|nr:flagellar regulator YcgR PilZN domain-containing protein [Nevskiaceae bacterium]
MGQLHSRGSAAQEITSHAAIAQLLGRLLDNRCQLAVRLPGAPITYSTILLEVDFAGGSLLLDEICPAAGNAYVQVGGIARLQGRLDGSRVDFDCEVNAVANQNGTPSYRAGVPQRVIYYERRGSYRLTIPPELKLPPTMLSAQAGAMAGRLVDISREGAGTLLSEADAELGVELACTIPLPDGQLSAEVEVRSARAGEDGLRVGLEFSHLTPAQRVSVDRAIAALERTLLRHHVNARWM